MHSVCECLLNVSIMVLNVFIYSVLASQIHQHFSNCCFGWKYLLLHVTLTKPEITLHVLLCIHLNGVVRTSSFVHFFCVSVCLSVCVLHHLLNWVSVCVWQTTLNKVRSSAKAIHAQSSCLKIHTCFWLPLQIITGSNKN